MLKTNSKEEATAQIDDRALKEWVVAE